MLVASPLMRRCDRLQQRRERNAQQQVRLKRFATWKIKLYVWESAVDAVLTAAPVIVMLHFV